MNDRYPSFFKTFAKVSRNIHSGKNVSEILNCIVVDLAAVLDAKGCIFWLLNHEKQKIFAKVCHGFDYQSLSVVDYETLIQIFPKDSDLTCIKDARNDTRIPDRERLGKKLVGSVTGLQIDISDAFTGVLAVYFFTANKTLDSQELELVKALSEQGALALQKTLGFDDKLLKMVRQIIESLTLAIEAKDPVTHGHSQRVAQLSRMTAAKLGLSGKELETIEHAAILHDIGKIGIEDTVIENLGKLNPRELKEIHQHPVLGAKILSPLTFFNAVEPLIKCHHELYDGSGYPKGLKEDQIPLGARIICVCDAFETMIAGRPGMRCLTSKQALEALEERAGTKFDPNVVQAFICVLHEHKDLIDKDSSTRSSLFNLRKNLLKIADQNKIKQKLSTKFPVSF